MMVLTHAGSARWKPYFYAYLDDITIVAPYIEKHIKWLEAVLEALKKANLQINLQKSEFCSAEVKYLGYIVNEGGLKTDEDFCILFKVICSTN